MPKLTKRMRIVLLTIVALVVLCTLGLFVVGALIAREKICIARTGVEPPQKHFDDPSSFGALAGEIEKRALASLVGQFDTTTGFFIYLANPNGTVAYENNDIRQLLASRSLALASREDESLYALHTQNLESIMEAWYREENGRGYVWVDEKSKLGANALLLRLIVASPAFETYQPQARALVRGIESLVTPEGAFRPWYKEPSYKYDADYLLTFYSGEALLALFEYAEKTGDARVFSLASRIQDTYVEKYATRIDENYYPAYVPWHTQSLSKLYEATGEKKYAEAIFMMNDRVLELQDTERFVGRFYNPDTPHYGSPHGSSDAVYTEGLAYAYEIALREGDTERSEIYERAIVLGVHNLSRLQYEPRFWILDAREAADRLEGGIMTHLCNRSVRIDTTAHTLDALAKITALWSAQ